MNNVKLILIIITIAYSCNYKLNQETQQWNPYKKSDVLIFKSNNNDFDSIKIENIQKYFSGRNEIESVNCTMSGQHTFLMALTAWESGRSVLSINLCTKSAIFHPFNAKRITWLDSLPKTRIEANGAVYNDVIILLPDKKGVDYSKFSSEKTFVEKIYWSKSNGLLRYDLKNGNSWILNKKFSLHSSTTLPELDEEVSNIYLSKCNEGMTTVSQ